MGGNTARAIAGKLGKGAVRIDQVNARGMAALIAQPLHAVGSNPVVAIAQSPRQRGSVDSLKLFANDEKVIAICAGFDEGNP